MRADYRTGLRRAVEVLVALAAAGLLVSLYSCAAAGVPPLVTFNDGSAAALGTSRGVNGASMLAGDGLLSRNSAARITDTPDGASNTLLAELTDPVELGRRLVLAPADCEGVG